MSIDRERERYEMVAVQIRARGIRDPDLIRAMEKVPRHLFIPERFRPEAYRDRPLPIGHGQTISQPYIVALMTSLLVPLTGKRILEIGTGSGYQAAVLAEMGVEVFSVERIPEVARTAVLNLEASGYDQVRIRVTDGTCGWADYAPYDAALITAATPSVPGPLIDQLADDGVLVAPVGPSGMQELIRLTRTRGSMGEERFGGVRFVPLIGEYGWKDSGFSR